MSRRSKPITPYLGMVRKMAETLSVLQQKVAALDTVSQADFTSVEDGSIDVYDDEGELRARLGKQADGSFSLKTFAPIPAVPTEPEVIPVPGGCVVEWDGTFEEAQEEPIQRVAIHVGYTADFEVNTGDDEDSDEEQTEKAAILSPRGGSAFLPLELGETDAWVRLTAVAEGGAESAPTVAVKVNIMTPEGAFWQDEFTLTEDGYGVPFELTYEPIPNSEHLYWNGLYQREDVAWSAIGRTVTLEATGVPPKAGDRITVEYAYLEPEPPEPLDGHSQRTAEGGIGSSTLKGDDSGDWTINFLYMLRSAPTARRVVTARTSGIGAVTWWHLYVDPDRGLVLDVIDGPKPAAGSLTLNAPTMVTIRYTLATNTMTVSLDAIHKATAVGGTRRTGKQWGMNGRYFGENSAAADVDEIAHFPRRLSDNEVTSLLQAWRQGQPLVQKIIDLGPDHYYRCDETSGSQWVDQINGPVLGGGDGANVNPAPPLRKGN